jgi:hypothetical protein
MKDYIKDFQERMSSDHTSDDSNTKDG